MLRGTLSFLVSLLFLDRLIHILVAPNILSAYIISATLLVQHESNTENQRLNSCKVLKN